MERRKDIRHFRDLGVYQRTFAAAMDVFQISKAFPIIFPYLPIFSSSSLLLFLYTPQP